MATRSWYAPACALALTLSGYGAVAAPLENPVSFDSVDGQLNLIMTARAAAGLNFNGVTTTGWVYDVCRRASPTAMSCLPGTAAAPYGGV